MSYDMVKDNGKKVTLQVTTDNGVDTTVSTFESKDRPTPDFQRAFAAFVAPLREAISSLKPDFDLQVHTVRIQYDEETAAPSAVIISASHELPKSNLVLAVNTPPLDLATYPKFKKVVDTLLEEATAFHEGKKRVQLQLDPAA